MALEIRQDLRLTQKLVLTPQLQQAIKLLQMPQLELSQMLTQELTENPFLEEDYGEEVDTTQQETEADIRETAYDDTELPFQSLVNYSVDDYFEERGSDGRDLGYFSADADEQPSFELFYSKKEDLCDHLLWQLRLINAPDNIRMIAEQVIGNLDDDGYLRATYEELLAFSGSDEQTINDAIALVQQFDPAGVAARNLQECLLLQIKAINLTGTLVEKMVLNNMDDLQKKKYPLIAKQYELPLDDIMVAVRIIEGLEPRPGRLFSSTDVTYVVPDVYMHKTDSGYQIVLNDDGMPKIRLNSSYRQLLTRKDTLTKEEREFLKEKLRLATELIKSLDQRNKTIYKVADSILRFQQEFFNFGSSQLKPLNLKDVASDISMHESTISRVTSNKFLACHHGIFSFRFFFSSALQSDNGDVSSTIVKEFIKKTISEENPQKPLSDQIVADRLKAQNITIARRTVAKYREELRIPPQSQRKSYI